MEFAISAIFFYMIRPLLVSITMILISCMDSKSLHVADALKSNCFWDVTDECDVIGGINSCYKFLPNGQCFFYYYNFYNKKRTDSVYRFEDIDIIVSPNWSVKGDTLLIARGTHYKVLSFNKDFVTVEGFQKNIMIFRRNCQTILERQCTR